MTPAALADLVRSVAHDVLAGHGLDPAALPATVTVQRPRDPEHGDYATNVALQAGKKAGVAPRELAGWLVQELTQRHGLRCAEVAGPGFLNLWLGAEAQGEIVAQVLAAGARFGSSQDLTGRRINLEFVSANPTGPLHLAHTRWAAVGDALGRILAFAGAAVTREYYVNDAGAQIGRLRSSEYGDDKDRPVLKSDGSPAYIAADIAYYLDKRARGFDLCVYMLGADHHGYLGRLKAAAAALGDDPATVEVLIGQLVNLTREGVATRMSKRAGTVVSMADLVEAVGVDAARYALVRSSYASPIDIDLDLWAKRTSDNPVFYVQYAHARLASLARNATDLRISSTGAQLGLLGHEREGELIRTLGEFPRIVACAAQLREPHRVARYLEELASTYHRFYDTCRALPMGEERPGPLHAARLALCEAARQVLANGLGLLGVSAPERM